MDSHETVRDEAQRGAAPGVRAGLLAVFSGAAPLFEPVPLQGTLAIGRSTPLGSMAPDVRMSRDHATVRFDGARWIVRDAGSQNGTYVDGVRIADEVSVVAPRCFRFGSTVVLPCRDLSVYAGPGPSVEGGIVVGPVLRRALAAVKEHAEREESVLLFGETGAGKELAAKTFAASTPRAGGPFVVVNAAAIPEGVAERLLFGTKRGAYSGAEADAPGYLQSAHGGCLFLDELGELDLSVQAKLLRALEAKEVLPLGASRPTKVDVLFCFASHRELRAAVAKGTFRADLLYRVTQAEVVIPPLRERLEELPWLLALAGEGTPVVAPSAEVVEACMVRAWPGNARELVGEARKAVRRARNDGATVLRAEHLAPLAGHGVDEATPAPGRGAIAGITRDELARALAGAETAAEAARRLGVHRSHLYRLLKRHGLDRQGSE